MDIESILSMLLHQKDGAGGIVSLYWEIVNCKFTSSAVNVFLCYCASVIRQLSMIYSQEDCLSQWWKDLRTHTLNALDILKNESKNLQASIKNREEFGVSCAEKLEAIDKLPQLAQDQTIIEQKEHELQEMVMYKEEELHLLLESV